LCRLGPLGEQFDRRRGDDGAGSEDRGCAGGSQRVGTGIDRAGETKIGEIGQEVAPDPS